MKRIIILLLVVLLLAGCSRKAEAMTWQEQYDLGIRYLSEGNYEEAILAFEAAIAIDPKQPDAYVGLAEAYEGRGDTEMAKTVLEQAVEELGELEVLTKALEKYQDETEETPDLSGEWQHSVYPDPYYMTLKKETSGNYTLYMEAVRGNYAQIATTTVKNVELVDGQAACAYEDSFGNHGMVYLTVNGEEINVRFETEEPYQGNWCVDAAAGTYSRKPASVWTAFHVDDACTIVQDGTGIIEQEEYLPRITMNEDGTYLFAVNYLEGMTWVEGTYRVEYDDWDRVYGISFEIEDSGMSSLYGTGFDGFHLYRGANDGLYYYEEQGMGATFSGSVFYLADEDTEPAKKWGPVGPTVSKVYEEFLNGGCYNIPAVYLYTISGDGSVEAPTDRANAKIYEELYQEIENVQQDGGYPHFDVVYDWHCSEDVVSVLVKVGPWPGDYEEYYSYNISQKTGEIMSLPELLETYDMTEETFYQKARVLMEDYAETSLTLDLPEDYIQQGIQDMLSEENMRTIRPFVNEYGRLCIAAKIQRFAGAGMYYYLFDLETGEHWSPSHWSDSY